MPQHLRRRMLAATLPFLLTASYGFAQPVHPPTAAEAQAALAPAPAAFSNAQLDQMLAPIALYPDQLLVQVLMAATFPDQLVDAQKWLQDGHNASLKGDDLAGALEPLPWDPSVKSLVAFPPLIAMLTSHLDWTQAIGTAFANQQVQTMVRVQFLRDRAKAAGQLKTTTQIAVREQDSDIIIEPADPNMVYVPVYNPVEVYGSWPDADAPPVYIPPPPGFYEGAVGAGIGFSVGLGVVAPLWGWGHPDWRRHDVIVDTGRYAHITRQNFITQNHITVEGGAWHRQRPIAFVPNAQRPQPAYRGGEPPKGTIRPDAITHPAFAPGPGPEQRGGPNGAARPNEAQPGQPGGPSQGARPGDDHAHPPGPGPRPQEEHGPPQGARPGEEHGQPGGPGPRSQEEHGPPQGARPGEGHAQPPGPGPRPQEEHGPPQGARPGEERAQPPAPGPRPQEEHGPPQGARPGEERAQPSGPGPRPQEEHGPPQGHPGEQHGAPPGADRAAPAQPPHPQEEHGPPAQPAAPPPQAAHPPGPPQGEAHPAPQAGPPHPAGPPPQEARPQGPPPQPQAHPGGPQHPGDHKPGDEDKK